MRLNRGEQNRLIQTEGSSSYYALSMPAEEASNQISIRSGKGYCQTFNREKVFCYLCGFLCLAGAVGGAVAALLYLVDQCDADRLCIDANNTLFSVADHNCGFFNATHCTSSNDRCENWCDALAPDDDEYAPNVTWVSDDDFDEVIELCNCIYATSFGG